MHNMGILMHMRTTLNINDELLEKARRLSGLKAVSYTHLTLPTNA